MSNRERAREWLTGDCCFLHKSDGPGHDYDVFAADDLETVASLAQALDAAEQRGEQRGERRGRREGALQCMDAIGVIDETSEGKPRRAGAVLTAALTACRRIARKYADPEGDDRNE